MNGGLGHAVNMQPLRRALHRQRHRAHRVIALLDTWRARSRERQTLMMMRDNELHDIGITRYDAVNEARKPFWRA